MKADRSKFEKCSRCWRLALYWAIEGTEPDYNDPRCDVHFPRPVGRQHRQYYDLLFLKEVV